MAQKKKTNYKTTNKPKVVKPIVIEDDDINLDSYIENNEENIPEENHYDGKNLINDLDELMKKKYTTIITHSDSTKTKEEQVKEFIEDNTDVEEEILEYTNQLISIYLNYDIPINLHEFIIKFDYYLLSNNLYIHLLTVKQIQRFIKYHLNYDINAIKKYNRIKNR